MELLGDELAHVVAGAEAKTCINTTCMIPFRPLKLCLTGSKTHNNLCYCFPPHTMPTALHLPYLGPILVQARTIYHDLQSHPASPHCRISIELKRSMGVRGKGNICCSSSSSQIILLHCPSLNKVPSCAL